MKTLMLALQISMALAASFAVLAPESASAQSVSCATLASIGNARSDDLVAELDEDVAGERYRINRRKTLRINGVTDISFSGCRITIDLDVTLERRIRRDAHGRVRIRGDAEATLVDARTAEICIDYPEVVDVDLSNTTIVGEAIYRGIANLVIPRRACFAVPIR